MFLSGEARAVLGIPDASGLIERRRHHAPAVAVERSVLEALGMAFENQNLLAAFGTPDAGGAVIRCCHHTLPSGIEPCTPDRRGMAIQPRDLAAIACIPDARALVRGR